MTAKPVRSTQKVRRLAALMCLDGTIVVASFWIALLLRFDGPVPIRYVHEMLLFCPIAVAILLVGAVLGRLYEGLASSFSVGELIRLELVVGITGAALLVLNEAVYFGVGKRMVPVSVVLIGTLVLFLALASLRSYERVHEFVTLRRAEAPDAHRVLIIGAGIGGDRVVRELSRDKSLRLQPVGFIDDDPAKLGRKIHGLPVIGPIDGLREAVSRTEADGVVVALPGSPSRVIEGVLARVAECGLKAKILPSLREMMAEAPAPVGIRDIDVADLIARPPVQIEAGRVTSIFEGRTVLITGAAGSIGSELSRKALYFKPAKLVIFDNNESELFSVNRRLQSLASSRGVELIMVLGDIRDRERVNGVFARHCPGLVFHAAAYKHVPVMEMHPEEAVITNVVGTRNVAEAAAAYGAERFVLVSTDKAVNPSSVMGATKRVAEMLISSAADGVADGTTATRRPTVFTSVRFGNVLASRGSVVPIFLEQIQQGGPITITHPDVTRYFMTIEEAVSLIFQAGALGRGGETFVLEMGDPVKIMDLADRMRSLMATGDRRIEIVVTGLRPGEKLHEELWHNYEDTRLVHPGILQVVGTGVAGDTGEVYRDLLAASVSELEHLSQRRNDPKEVMARLFALVYPAPDQILLVDDGGGGRLVVEG